MARQVEEGGWPLGLQPLNVRAVSFSTMISGSPSSSSYSSSDLDTEVCLTRNLFFLMILLFRHALIYSG
ncbi:hypothetical protein Hdeb2414_s0010g00357881 [Helianthus debilis subsp. tardiflorus]